MDSFFNLIQTWIVSVKMITGDAIETAISIGNRIGIYNTGDTCLSGAQIDQLSDADLEQVIFCFNEFWFLFKLFS